MAVLLLRQAHPRTRYLESRKCLIVRFAVIELNCSAYQSCNVTSFAQSWLSSSCCDSRRYRHRPITLEIAAPIAQRGRLSTRMLPTSRRGGGWWQIKMLVIEPWSSEASNVPRHAAPAFRTSSPRPSKTPIGPQRGRTITSQCEGSLGAKSK